MCLCVCAPGVDVGYMLIGRGTFSVVVKDEFLKIIKFDCLLFSFGVI